MIEAILTQLLRSAGSDWSEAILAEADHLPSGRARNRWLWGGVLTVFSEGPMRTVRFGAIAVVVAVIAMTAAILVRYPHAVGGKGGPFYTAFLAILLIGYAGVAWVLTARPGSKQALRVGGGAGLIGAVLLASAFQLPLVPTGLLGLATGVLALLASLKEPRAETGVWTGMTAALVNLAIGTALVLAFPSRVPMDDDVLRANHTAPDILAANIGEHLVGYVLFLVLGPLLGAVFGMIGMSLAQRRRSTQTGS